MGTKVEGGEAQVLVVGPAGEERSFICGLLSRDVGARVLVASTAHEVLEILGLLESRRGGRDLARMAVIDMIVASLGLPDLGALALCRKIRQARGLRDTPFIVVSEQGEDEALAAAFDAGASEFVRKPVRALEFVVRARAALRTSQAKLRSDERARRMTGLARRLQQDAQELQSLVCVDALTGLANHRHIEFMFHGTWHQAARSGRGIAALLVDIDSFHAYNERHGHLAGDACLKRVAKELALSLRRPGDLAGRWGGEEFVGLLPETDSEGARVVGERLRGAVEQLKIAHGAEGCGPVVTISIGYAAAVPREGDEPEALFAAADAALFRAKAAGRNCVVGDANATCLRREPAGPGATMVHMPDPVVVDPSLAERLPKLLAAHARDLRTLDLVIEAHDFDRLRFIARELRTLAARHGFATAELATRLEHAASQRALGDARAIAGDLCWYLEHVPVVYRRTTGKISRG